MMQMKGENPIRTLCASVFIGYVLAGSILPLSALAREPDPARFQQAIYALSKKLIGQQPVRKEETKGRYGGEAAKDYSYIDRRYFAVADGRLISHIRVDGDNPDIVHIVEVNIYDDKGRVIRDFGSISVPWSPVRPINTMIDFHHYNGQLHSYRQYDVFGDIKYQFCEGKLNGLAVHIALDDYDLADMDSKVKLTADYRACFDGMPTDWSDYVINPH